MVNPKFFIPLFILWTLVAFGVEAQEDCLCPGFVRGPQAALVTGPGMQIGVQVASNSLDGSYLVAWSSEIVMPADSEVQTSIQGMIAGPSLMPISPVFTLILPKTYPENWSPWVAAAAFHPIHRSYFVILNVPLKDASGSFYNVLRGYIVSSNGTILAKDLQISTNGPHTVVAFDRTGVLYNSVNHEFLVYYTFYAREMQRHVLQRFNAQGFKVAPYRVYPTAEYVRHDFKTNRYVLVDSTFFGNQSEIHAQVVDAALRKIGGMTTVFSVPYDNQKNLKGPFPVYNSERGQFLVFWSYGPWNNPAFQVRPVTPTGNLLNEIRTDLHKPILSIRYNPMTGGYLLLPNYSKVTHITKDFDIIAEFVFPCNQTLPAGKPAVVFSRSNSEFLLTWFNPLRYGADINVYARQLEAVVSRQSCSK